MINRAGRFGAGNTASALTEFNTDEVSKMAETTRICSVPECGKVARYKSGYCKPHHLRWFRHGDPLAGRPSAQESTENWLRRHAGIERDDCLTFPFSRNRHGYGTASVAGQRMFAHRAMCLLVHGEPPTLAHVAAHSCGKGHLGCVNPRHLRWATMAENNADMAEHGTVALGERNGQHKLTEDDVREIWKLRGVVPQRRIAERFAVSPSNIAVIHSGRSWRHVTQA